MLVNETGLLMDFSPGHITQQTTELQCEVLRMSGPVRGTVTVTTASLDGTMTTKHSVPLVFSDPPADGSLSSTALVGGGLGGLAFLGALVFLLRGRGENEPDVETVPLVQAGPPVSTLQTEKEVPELEESEGGTEQSGDPPPASQIASPPLPEDGLPPGWTQEQWQYYGQQYLDGTL